MTTVRYILLFLLSLFIMIHLQACQHSVKDRKPITSSDRTTITPQTDNSISSTNTVADTIITETSEKSTSETIQASPPPHSDTDTKPDLITKTRVKITTQSSGEIKHKSAPLKPKPLKFRSRKTLPGQNRFYDRKNPHYKTLQKANHALAGFPLDNEGQIDWVHSLHSGKIKPRSTVRSRRPMETLDSDIIMKNTREMDYVLFPHKEHTEWLACKNCHDRIFIEQKGANEIDMTKIFQGEYCGVCHDKVAFSSFVCERCHSVSNTVENK